MLVILTVVLLGIGLKPNLVVLPNLNLQYLILRLKQQNQASWKPLVDAGCSASVSMNQDQIILAMSPGAHIDPTAPTEPALACRQLRTHTHTCTHTPVISHGILK